MVGYSFFSYDAAGHLVALTGAAALHAGIAAWAMAPEPPAIVPQQQVIQVAMVAPTVIRQQEAPQLTPTAREIPPPMPPKETGMVKAQPVKAPVRKAPPIQEKKAEVRQETTLSETRLTSGMQSPEAVERKAAITEPVAASYLKNTPPEYPAHARRRKQQGTVMLEVRVTAAGMPKMVDISRSSGYRMLDKAALEAVRRWKFVPARRGSERVEASVVVPVEFRIN